MSLDELVERIERLIHVTSGLIHGILRVDLGKEKLLKTAVEAVVEEVLRQRFDPLAKQLRNTGDTIRNMLATRN